MQNILKYIFSFILLSFFCFSVTAQIKTKKHKGIKVGVDIAKIIVSNIKDNKEGYGVSLDYQFNQRYFIVCDAGYESIIFRNNKNDSILLIDYEGGGYFGRIGIDNNLFKEGNDIMLVGFRLGYSIFDHHVKSITIQDEYWGDYTSAFDEKTLNALWMEGVFGLRVELLKNFFMGYTIHLNLFLNGKKDNIMPPYRIPGYGNGEKKVTFKGDYMIYYRIPF